MYKFFLEIPSINRKEQALDYLNEHIKFNSNINGTGGMDKCLKEITYEEWLIEREKKRDKEYAYSINKVPGEVFFLIRKNDNKLVGMISIRHNLTPVMLKFGGHIGYGIRPTERRNGYNKINLYLGLLEAEKIGLDKVMIDCSVTNLGSDRTIKSLGGVLERTEIDPSDNTLTNVYWIDVSKSLQDYKTTYMKYIIT
ncbi:GNAT family N-acetyltransferase [Vallitalea guaymasensis]|uniref:GNAT family N-acetyltransferase n=1 Tax=Vallitalea guaymasensis TaxID=1185412 RepID=A0A8J8SDK4_9FIRM|nr:GNAT family N-acetyltransferase [Vallitalea guaymasensis]QUH30968.1 GNAT family N-acetyltransferase [Vallitalea guaymasensis]